MLIVGIAGGSGSGKTTFVRKVTDVLPAESYSLLPQDSYYRDNSHLTLEQRQELNFDHPDSVDWPLMAGHLSALRHGETVCQPTYSFLTCTRQPECVLVEPKSIVIVEGILILTRKEIRDLLDIKVFVDADADDRLSRVIQRDIRERGRSAESVLHRYSRTVKPMHRDFIEPSRQFADVVIPHGGENAVAAGMLSAQLLRSLTESGIS